MKALKLLFILLLTLSACVEEFRPEVEGVSGILVVDGTITNGESEFYLSRSISILDTLRGENNITNATMEVERSDGATYPAVHEGNGRYKIQTGDLDYEKEYRLNFSIDGKKYQSTFLKPIKTVEIDSLSWRKGQFGEPLWVYLDTHGGEDDSPYYKWSFKETWEVTAHFFAVEGYVNGKLVDFDRNTPNNRYYCWARDSSKSLLLESTTDLTENRIARKTLIEISPKDERISHLYHIDVSQIQLREEAYDYFKILQEEIERTGGLFSIIMSAGDNGNIFCLDNPEETIIGYVEVASTTKKAMYIEYTRENRIFEGDGVICWQEKADHKRDPKPWIQGLTYSTWYCVDCREHYNATKDKPEWWPTDHW